MEYSNFGRVSATEHIIVSTEISMFMGFGLPELALQHEHYVSYVYVLGKEGGSPTLLVDEAVAFTDTIDAVIDQYCVTLFVSPKTLEKLHPQPYRHYAGCRVYLPESLRLIVNSLLECDMASEMMTTYRTAKALELLCETVRLGARGELIPCLDQGGLSAADIQKIVYARQVIDEKWGDKLSLDLIARACGLNRSKLTCGFRQLFHCSVSEALIEKRLVEARKMLAVTDFSVSTIAYKAGYRNNASFTRAFGRRFGASPTEYRTGKIAA
ncbi:helix-turn-helix transcriptional regulator [Kordiimonas pumila]|uniref:Helix-turn-helix transcriptional regulator n=1 Tax=Kordiimonas pumila TaxID=2161677 RepID=A0ABV7D4U0_9PROT|nr:AraC family transcriptional regulator [Kordiimonas pumila]